MPRFRARSLLVVPLLALLALVGCGDEEDDLGDAGPVELGAPEEFCSAWVELAVAVPQAFVGSEQHLDALAVMVEEAPPEIAEDAATWLAWAEEVAEEGDPGDELEDFPPEVEDAVFNVSEYAREECPEE